MFKFDSGSQLERDPRLFYGQKHLSSIGELGIGLALMPFHAVDRRLARSLTTSAGAVPDTVVRDFGQQRIDGYRTTTGKTLSRVRRVAKNSDVEAYAIVAVNPYTKKRSDMTYALGVATISIAEIVPADDETVASLRDVLGADLTGVVGTFWYGYPEVSIQSDTRIGGLVAGLLVPRMVEIAEDAGTYACTFVASEASGEPDQTDAMRERMGTVATGKWLSPVDNPAVEYDLLVA
jgi:hypothetical protein